MRFRCYLGDQYRNPQNIQEVVDKTRGHTRREALPLLMIYFLGHGLEYVHAPVIRVRRESIDVATGELALSLSSIGKTAITTAITTTTNCIELSTLFPWVNTPAAAARYKPRHGRAPRWQSVVFVDQQEVGDALREAQRAHR